MSEETIETETQKLYKEYGNKCAEVGHLFHEIHILEGRLRAFEKQLEVAQDNVRKAGVKYTESFQKDQLANQPVKVTPEETHMVAPI